MLPNTEVFLISFFYYLGKADLIMGYWNPEIKLGVTGHFFRDNSATISKNSKMQSNVWSFFQIEALFSIKKKCMVTPSFLFGYQKHLLSSAFSA